MQVCLKMKPKKVRRCDWKYLHLVAACMCKPNFNCCKIFNKRGSGCKKEPQRCGSHKMLHATLFTVNQSKLLHQAAKRVWRMTPQTLKRDQGEKTLFMTNGRSPFQIVATKVVITSRVSGSIPDICPFWYTATLFRPVKSTSKTA